MDFSELFAKVISAKESEMNAITTALLLFHSIPATTNNIGI